MNVSAAAPNLHILPNIRAWIVHRGKAGISVPGKGTGRNVRGVIRDELDVHVIRTSPEWISQNDSSKAEQVVNKAKLEAVEVDATFGNCVAFAVHPTYGVEFYDGKCFDSDGNLEKSSEWDTYVYDTRMAEKDLRLSTGATVEVISETEDTAEAAEPEVAAGDSDDDEFWQEEGLWHKNSCRSEKLYHLKEAESYYKAAADTLEEVDAKLTSDQQEADEAYAKYTKMIAKSTMRAVPLVRPHKPPVKFESPSADEYIFKVAFMHHGWDDDDVVAEAHDHEAEAEKKMQKKRFAAENAERDRLAREHSKEEAEAIAAEREYQKQQEEAEVARARAAEIARDMRKSEDAEERERMKKELAAARALAEKEMRDAKQAAERAERERLEAEQAKARAEEEQREREAQAALAKAQ